MRLNGMERCGGEFIVEARGSGLVQQAIDSAGLGGIDVVT
jgi:hypothetical protein